MYRLSRRTRHGSPYCSDRANLRRPGVGFHLTFHAIGITLPVKPVQLDLYLFTFYSYRYAISVDSGTAVGTGSAGDMVIQRRILTRPWRHKKEQAYYQIPDQELRTGPRTDCCSIRRHIQQWFRIHPPLHEINAAGSERWFTGEHI